MLETLDLTATVAKAEYRRRMPGLQRRLHQLQQVCWREELATVVVFEGWDFSGKGQAIKKLTRRLEPRGFSIHAVHQPRTWRRSLPWMHRYWMMLPGFGQMAIFDHSWYRRVLLERVEGLVDPAAVTCAFRDIRFFEQTLGQGRYRLVKLFFHLAASEQRRRMAELEADPHESWRVERHDWQRLERYDEYRVAAEEMLRETESEWGPWTLVAATSSRWARLRAATRVIETMEDSLRERDLDLPAALEAEREAADAEDSTEPDDRVEDGDED